MLAPQFSLRSILAVTAVCGFVSLIGAAALRGTPWAMAVVIAIAALALILAIHGLMFFVMWVFSLLLPTRRSGAVGQSPFAPPPANES
jgi:hypothetical protein